MSNSSLAQVIPVDHITCSILILRGHKVLLDRHLAQLYGVKPIALRQQVKRNPDRFPEDFMFQLNEEEAQVLVSQSVIPSMRHLGGALPFAFTQEGIAMLSSVLRSPRAVRVNLAIMRAFVRLREIVVSNKEIAKRLDELETRLTRQVETHDQAIVGIFKMLRELMNPLRTNAIGFTANIGSNPRRGLV